MKTHLFYKLLKYSGRIGLRLFFGNLTIMGKEGLPKDGALFFAPNHQGAFMDAVLTAVFPSQSIHFLTRADIFNKRSLPWLRSLNMMPIYRIRDGYGSLSQNDAVFETCFKILTEQENILVFPEGNHSPEFYLRPLSKGTARLALDARQAVDPKVKIYIVPTGLNYFSHRRPLSRFILHYGKPIDLDDYMELFEEHKQKGYNKLKDDLTEAMKEVMILPERTEDYEERKKWLFQPKHEHLPFDELKRMGQQETFEPRKVKSPGMFRQALIAFFSLFNILPLLGLKKVLKGIKDKAFLISLKYYVGGGLHILWWIVVYTIGAVWIGWEAGLLFMSTAILAMYARQSLIKY